MHAAKEAHALGAKVVAVSDVSGAIYNEDGLNIPEVMEFLKENRVLKGCPNCEEISNEDLIELEI